MDRICTRGVYYKLLLLLLCFNFSNCTEIEGELGYFIKHQTTTSSHNSLHHQPTPEFYIRTGTGLPNHEHQLIGLDFSKTPSHYQDLSRIVHWHTVKVHGNHTNKQTLIVDKIIPTQMRMYSYMMKAPTRMRTITFHFNSICNKYTDMTPLDVRYRYFNDNSIFKSFKNYFRTCSMNRTLFLPEDNLILSGIDFPCYGKSKSGYRYNMNKCDNEEMYSLAEFVEDYAISKGIDLSSYNSRILLLPKGMPCWWAGLASIGCAQACYTWTIMSKTMPFNILMHELGHNNGLMHSNLPGVEYGDSSCTMGVSPQVCFNAAQSWRLGWHTPQATLYVQDFDKLTRPLIYNIKCQQTNQNSIVLIMDSSMAYTISYRCSQGKYEKYLGNYNNKVSIHSTNTDISQPSPTTLLSMLSRGQIAHIPSTNVMIKCGQTFSTHASVSICRGIC